MRTIRSPRWWCSAATRLVCTTLLVVSLTSPTSAAASDAGGPGEAYLAYRETLDTGKLKKAKKHLSKGRVYELMSLSDEEAIAELKVLDPLVNLTVASEDEHGDVATVTARGEAMGMGATGTIQMIREGGRWKVLSEMWELGGGGGEKFVEAGAPIQDAARAGDLASVAAAIESGANVDAQDDSGNTALCWAATYNHTEVIEALIAAGADPNLASDDGDTPMLTAASAGSPEALIALVGAGADVNLANESGRTPLLGVVGMSDWSVDQMPGGEADAVRMIEALIGAGADVNSADPFHNRTALMVAAETGRPSVVKALIEAGADIDRPVSADDGTTAVMEAAKSGNAETVSLLVDAGADLGGADRTGKTIVDWAADYPEIVEILVEKGVEGADSVESSLDVMICADDDPQPAIDGLRAKGYPVVEGSQLLNAAAQGDSEAVRLFLKAGIPVNHKDERDHASTALNRAVSFPEETDTALLLISCGADPNAGFVPALVNAAQKCGFTEVVEALIEAGADPNTAAASGFSALQFAEMMNCDENARVLREAGAE